MKYTSAKFRGMTLLLATFALSALSHGQAVYASGTPSLSAYNTGAPAENT